MDIGQKINKNNRVNCVKSTSIEPKHGVEVHPFVVTVLYGLVSMFNCAVMLLTDA